MRSRILNPIKKKLCREYNISEEELKLILDSTYKVIKDSINTSDREKVWFPNVRLSGLGMFYVKNGKRDFFRKFYNLEDDIKQS